VQRKLLKGCLEYTNVRYR